MNRINLNIKLFVKIETATKNLHFMSLALESLKDSFTFDVRVEYVRTQVIQT